MIGTTVAGYGNGSLGTDALGLQKPRGIYVTPLNEALYVCDAFNGRVQRFDFGDRNGVTVAGGHGVSSMCNSNQVHQSWGIFVDGNRNIYVADRNCKRVARWAPNATQGTAVVNNTGPWGITSDQYGNSYTALFDLHVILRNNDTILFGQYNTSGNSSTSLSGPRGLFFDQNTSSLFVCDAQNHRIQKFHLNSSVGITVAGGNGAGLASDQLNQPTAVWFSSKTGFIYIADTSNHRIQRWKMTDTGGVTITGNGTAGLLPPMLDTPVGLALNMNGTFLYASEQGNHRVQRFNLLCFDNVASFNQSAACKNSTFFL